MRMWTAGIVFSSFLLAICGSAWVHRGIHGAESENSQPREDGANTSDASANAGDASAEKSKSESSQQKPADSPPFAPQVALQKFEVPESFIWENVLAEPEVRQPVYMNFDERGRLWVVQYLQYPFPAGLKVLSQDKFRRSTFDKVPPAPPHHFPGEDKITIHEDTDGDGRFDRHKTFVEGLNIVSSVLPTSDGAWVLNPPYLLFYPDKNRDDVPDADPQVHLSGFGLEDTHSVVNSLQWGPDGWLYAAQGSTVSGHVIRPDLDKEKQAVHSMGQLIWRYHPATRRYEVFAEGGGNAFGVEIDAAGSAFSGHNGGDTRGFHYVQGAYLQKGFNKHGALSNPFAFGYFPAMKHATSVLRFTHNFVIYEGGAFPEEFHGKLFAIAPLQSHVVMASLETDGSTYKTTDLLFPVTSTDPWFRPVDIKVGPDGGIYVADFYEGQIAHLRHHEGIIDKSTGRIYRLKSAAQALHSPADLSNRTTAELVEDLAQPNKWRRRTALRLIGERQDKSVVPRLKEILAAERGPLALETLWALNLLGELNDELALSTLGHANPLVRSWCVRLLGDAREVSPAVGDSLVRLAETEPDLSVQIQLACTARRLPPSPALPMLRGLMQRDESAADSRLGLLIWWGLESQCDSHPDEVVRLFADGGLWNHPVVKDQILSRVMRRFAAAGNRKQLLHCVQLLEMSPSMEHGKILMTGFEEAFQGRSLSGLPNELTSAIEKVGGGSVILGVRQKKPMAIEQALRMLADPNGNAYERGQLAQVFGEVAESKGLPLLMEIAQAGGDEGLRVSAIAALQSFDDPQVPEVILKAYPGMSEELRGVAQTLLTSRKTWARQFVVAAHENRIDRATIPMDSVRKLTIHRDETIASLVKEIWGEVEGASTAEMQEQVERLRQVITSGSGSPYEGKKLFQNSCGKCHKLFDTGGQVGPDLTTFKRDDLGNMLVNIINPSAEIREGFETFVLSTQDGRVLTGFLQDRDNQVIVIKGADGQAQTIEQANIDELLPSKKSVMPERLLSNLTEEQVRDLFAYLRSSQPLAD